MTTNGKVRATAIGPGLDGKRLGVAGLTPREINVLELVALGLINDAIGLALGISPRTVQKHLERIHEKLGVGTRAAVVAAAFAIAHGLSREAA